MNSLSLSIMRILCLRGVCREETNSNVISSLFSKSSSSIIVTLTHLDIWPGLKVRVRRGGVVIKSAPTVKRKVVNHSFIQNLLKHGDVTYMLLLVGVMTE